MPLHLGPHLSIRSHESLGQQEREVGWVAGEPEAAVLSALGDRLADPGLVHEAVHVTLHTASGPLLGVVAAAGFGAPVRLALTVRETRSRLVGVELARTSGTAALPTSLALALWQELEAASVTRLRCLAAWVGAGMLRTAFEPELQLRLLPLLQTIDRTSAALPPQGG